MVPASSASHRACRVDGDAARDVDHVAPGAQRGEHLLVDRVVIAGVGAHGHHQDVGPLGEPDQRRVVGVGHVRRAAPVVIADLHLEGGGARGDLGADRSQPVDAEALPGQLRRDRRALDDVAAPAARAREAVAADHAARAGDDEPNGELRHRRRVGVAGVRDDDAARPRRRAVDALVAGAVAGDQPELGQRVHQRRVGPEAADGDEGAGVARLRRNGVGLRRLPDRATNTRWPVGQTGAGEIWRRRGRWVSWGRRDLAGAAGLAVLHCSTTACGVQAQ